MRAAFYDCPECPHYKGDGKCQCVRAADFDPWWSRWWWKLLAYVAWKHRHRKWR